MAGLLFSSEVREQFIDFMRDHSPTAISESLSPRGFFNIPTPTARGFSGQLSFGPSPTNNTALDQPVVESSRFSDLSTLPPATEYTDRFGVTTEKSRGIDTVVSAVSQPIFDSYRVILESHEDSPRGILDAPPCRKGPSRTKIKKHGKTRLPARPLAFVREPKKQHIWNPIVKIPDGLLNLPPPPSKCREVNQMETPADIIKRRERQVRKDEKDRRRAKSNIAKHGKAKTERRRSPRLRKQPTPTWDDLVDLHRKSDSSSFTSDSDCTIWSSSTESMTSQSSESNDSYDPRADTIVNEISNYTWNPKSWTWQRSPRR